MNNPLIKRAASIAAAAAALVLLDGTPAAVAAETRSSAAAVLNPATDNPLYKRGRVTFSCKAGTYASGSTTAYKTFVSKIKSCLDTLWQEQITKAGFTFAKPALTFHSGSVKTPCGTLSPSTGVQYCSSTATIYAGLKSRSIRDSFEVSTVASTAAAYGYHVERLAGIFDVYNREYQRTTGAARDLLVRRAALQSDCFGATFMRSIKQSLPISSSAWNSYLTSVTKYADQSGETKRLKGSAAAIRYWLTQGFTNGRPGDCNTWAASASRVT